MALRAFDLVGAAIGLVALVACGSAESGTELSEAENRIATADMIACDGLTPLSSAAYQTVDPANIKQSIIDAAIRHYSSRARCENGGLSFSGDERLLEVARDHSADMARLDFFAHESTVSGKESLGDRFGLGGVTYRAGAENLASVSLFNFPPNVRFQVIDEGRCLFRDPQTRTLYQRQNYAELAQNVVDSWMDSPGHRANLLSPKYSRMGSGIAIDLRNNDYCGQVYATQNFAD